MPICGGIRTLTEKVFLDLLTNRLFFDYTGANFDPLLPY